MLKKIENYYWTLKYLKKSQLYYLLKNRLKRGKKAIVRVKAPKTSVLPLWIEELDENKEYLARFSVEEILRGNVTLLHERGKPEGKNWENPGKSHLWNFNLHYLEFLIPLAAAYKEEADARYYRCFRRYCRRWIQDNEDGSKDGWHPYTISLRLTNLWICLSGFGEIVQMDMEFLQELEDSMYAQYLHLQKTLERHLLGNHYFENIKAVLLGALYFQETEVYQKYQKLLQNEIKEQILADGVHYERSLMYHKIILEDLMRVARVVMETDDAPFYKELWDTIKKMINALYSIEGDMGHTPLFNDAGDGVARPYESLFCAALYGFTILPEWRPTFKEAGYYCLENNNLKLIFDAGEIAPDYMPGHGHCDGLSFELSIAKVPLFVNAGTGQYQGPLRAYFRSTAAHNTVVVDGEEQSECWGEHRVGKRIRKVSGSCGEDWVKGSLTSCTRKRHSRKITLKEVDERHTLTILDKVQGHAKAYLHLAPGFEYRQIGKHIVVKFAGRDLRRICEIKVEKNDQVTIHREGMLCSYAPEFGKIEQIQVLEIAWDGRDKAHKIEIKFG